MSEKRWLARFFFKFAKNVFYCSSVLILSIVAADGWVRNKLKDGGLVLDAKQRVKLASLMVECDESGLLADQVLGKPFGSANQMFGALHNANLIPDNAVFVDVIGADRAVDKKVRFRIRVVCSLFTLVSLMPGKREMDETKQIESFDCFCLSW